VVDRVASLDEVLEELKKLAGEDTEHKTFHQMDLVAYAGLEVRPGKGKNRVAVLYAEGEIVDGEGRSDQVGGDRVSRELRKLRLDADVKAVVLRVNSPGGSASASDLIQREVILTQKTKPLVVSMGTYAASGGYWISTYADRIFAHPTTLTGSIGVFGLLPSFQKLANEHGVTFDGVQTARLGMLGTVTRPHTDAELARIQGFTDSIYEQFLSKVSEGRKLEREKVQEIAQGRVWSGVQAQKLGLVDELGTLMDAAKFAAEKAGVGGDYRMDMPEGRKSFAEQLAESLKDESRPKARSAVDVLMGDVQRQVDILRSLNDPRGVYARMPFELALR
jgi:protease IV